MSWLDELFGGGVTSEDLWMPAAGDAVSNYLQATNLFDQAGTSGYDMFGSAVDTGYPEQLFSNQGNNYAEQYGLMFDEPGGSVASMGAATAPSAWDSFNTGLQKMGDFTSSKGGQFLMGGLGGLASYLDAKKKNALMKQMMEQAAAEKAAKAAKVAQYDAPARVTNMKTALPSWGAGSQAFSGNSLAAMTPRSSGTMYAAEGGSAEAPKKTGALDFLRFMITGEAERQTPQQKEAARLEAERRAKMSPSELQAEKINNAYEDGRLQKATQRARGGYIPGEAPGQSDKVPAMLSDGEFVMDADTVSALGDGNNAAGAGALEKMRQNIRKHKRKAPINKIPPKAKRPEAYLKGAK